mmetsp:Transcript_2159/g.4569  ORF Transcript_2159/g.4569 Transcript_2159/m.4569 type:complete len:393 (-) Transcript_2159:80-1258(-)
MHTDNNSCHSAIRTKMAGVQQQQRQSPKRQVLRLSAKRRRNGNIITCHSNAVSTSLTVLVLCSSLLSLLLLPTLLRWDKSTGDMARHGLTGIQHDDLQVASSHHEIDDSRSCFHARQSLPSPSSGQGGISSGGISSSSRNYSLPILNLGFPKGGSTSLQHYFACGGLDTSHFKCRKKLPKHGPNVWQEKGVQCGKCIRYTLHQDLDAPLLERCGEYQVYTQLDVENDWSQGGCYFPQIQALDVLHDQNPHATFVLTFRPVNKWIDSLSHWRGFDRPMMERLGKCHNLPGLVGTTPQDFADWWCGHVEFVRDFVEDHPSHKLVEVEIEAEDAGTYMEEHFGIDSKCWEHTNKNVLKDAADEEVRDMDVKHDNLPAWMKKHIRKKQEQQEQMPA